MQCRPRDRRCRPGVLPGDVAPGDTDLLVVPGAQPIYGQARAVGDGIGQVVPVFLTLRLVVDPVVDVRAGTGGPAQEYLAGGRDPGQPRRPRRPTQPRACGHSIRRGAMTGPGDRGVTGL